MILTSNAPTFQAQLASSQREHADRLGRLESRLATYVQSQATGGGVRPAPAVAPERQRAPPQAPAPKVAPPQAAPMPVPAPSTKAAPPAAAPKPLPPSPPRAETREEKVARRKAEEEAKKAVDLAKLQAEVDATVAAAERRGIDHSVRLRTLHVPTDARIPVSSADAYGAPKHWGGLRDILLDNRAKLAVCPIEKVRPQKAPPRRAAFSCFSHSHEHNIIIRMGGACRRGGSYWCSCCRRIISSCAACAAGGVLGAEEAPPAHAGRPQVARRALVQGGHPQN